MITVDDVEDSWNVLAGIGTTDEELRVRELPDGASETEGVLFALDADGRRHVLIEVGERDNVSEDRRSSGVHVVRHRLLDGGKARVFVDLFCRKPHLHAAFSHVVCEVLSLRASETRRPDQICADVLDKWRELLERGPSASMSPQDVIGLFGELWVLRDIVRRDPRAFACWKGPFGWHHDFACERLALEVKTITTPRWTCDINGLDQLVAPVEGELFLTVLKVERDSNGESLGDLVADIITSGLSRSTVASVLDSTGIAYAESSDAFLGQLVEMRMYPVDARFPRVVPQDLVEGRLRPGVQKIRYQVDLGDESLPRLDGRQIAALLDRVSEAHR